MTTDTPRREVFEKAFALWHTKQFGWDGTAPPDGSRHEIQTRRALFWEFWKAALAPPSAEAKPGLTEREQQTVDSVRSEISKRKSYIDMADGEIDCAVLLAIITRLTTGGQKL